MTESDFKNLMTRDLFNITEAKLPEILQVYLPDAKEGRSSSHHNLKKLVMFVKQWVLVAVLACTTLLSNALKAIQSAEIAGTRWARLAPWRCLDIGQWRQVQMVATLTLSTGFPGSRVSAVFLTLARWVINISCGPSSEKHLKHSALCQIRS